jgi:short-subunit dehydrogenase
MKICIFGAGPGLSRSVANLFGKNGFAVSLIARHEDKLQQEAKLLEASNIKVDYIAGDVSEENFMTGILEKLNSIDQLPDVILYNAFIANNKGIEEESWENIKRQFDVNVGGAFNILKFVLPIYKQAGHGKIFFTGGGFGLQPDPDYLALSMSKAALRNLTYASAKKVENSNVHIATVTVCGSIGGLDPKYSPDSIAAIYWDLYQQQRGHFQIEVVR